MFPAQTALYISMNAEKLIDSFETGGAGFPASGE